MKTSKAPLTGMLGLALSIFLTDSAFSQSAPYQPLPSLGLYTNGATYLPDYSQGPSGGCALCPLTLSPNSTTNFQGLTDDTTAWPPDVGGAVGTNFVVSMLNTQVRILTRGGATVQTMSLSSFWSSTNIGSFTEVFDPRIVYDPYNDRWIASAAVEPDSSNSGILIGVSLTGNPTNGWNLRRVKADSSSLRYADFPTLGFSRDWAVVQANMFWTSASGNAGLSRSHFYVFNKTNLYAGNFTSPTLLMNTNNAFTEFPAATYDSSLSTLYLIQNVVGNFQGHGYVRLLSITGPIGSETLNNAGTNAIYLQVNATWDDLQPNSGADFAPQLGLSVKVQNSDSRLGNLVYRNGYLWFAHTVFLPSPGPTHSAIQWWQLNPNYALVQFGRIEDTTGTNYYAFPSIAVNRFNDALIGFSRFSSNQYVSANYAFRAFNDTANTMQTDRSFRAGEDSYWKYDGANRNRWGDFTATSVDPVNDADFWTHEEYSTPHFGSLTNRSGRWATWWANVTVPVPANDNFSSAAAVSGPQGTTNGTNVRATKESGEPNHAGNVGGASVWYTWTAPAGGSNTVDTIGSTFDTLLAVYTGATVSNLTSIVSDHGSAGNGASRVSFTAVSNTTYRIAVDGYNGAMGSVVLNWIQPIIPVFTLQPKSTNVIAGNSVTFTVTAIGAPTPAYQWQLNATNISGATSSNYTKTNVAAGDAGDYRCVATNSVGTNTSATAVLTVYPSATATLSAFAFTNSQFQVTVTGVPGHNYIVQASTNLSTWTPLKTNSSPFTFTDTVATNYAQRFYRALYLP